jgi:hypothetical protein
MFSLFVRRTHMYLALFLTPWIALYATASLAMNHRQWIIDYYEGDLWRSDVESERDYQPDLPADANDEEIANYILNDLGIPGPHTVNRSANARQLNISRDDPLAARQIVYRQDENKLVVRKFPFRPATTLVRLHHRHGFSRGDPFSTIWALSADLVAVAIVFWAASGLWMWWQLKSTRRFGLACVAFGIGLFAFFLATI